MNQIDRWSMIVLPAVHVAMRKAPSSSAAASYPTIISTLYVKCHHLNNHKHHHHLEYHHHIIILSSLQPTNIGYTYIKQWQRESIPTAHCTCIPLFFYTYIHIQSYTTHTGTYNISQFKSQSSYGIWCLLWSCSSLLLPLSLLTAVWKTGDRD